MKPTGRRRDDPAWRKRVGSAIRAYRTRADLSIAQLARDTGIDPSTLSDIERGTQAPDFGTVEVIADALKAPIDALVGRGMKPISLLEHPALAAEGRPRSTADRLANLYDALAVALELIDAHLEVTPTESERLRAAMQRLAS